MQLLVTFFRESAYAAESARISILNDTIIPVALLVAVYDPSKQYFTTDTFYLWEVYKFKVSKNSVVSRMA